MTDRNKTTRKLTMEPVIIKMVAYQLRRIDNGPSEA